MPYPFILVSNIPLVKKHLNSDTTIPGLPHFIRGYAKFSLAVYRANEIARENSQGCAAIYSSSSKSILYATDTSALSHTLVKGNILMRDLNWAGAAFYEVIDLVGNNGVTIKELDRLDTPKPSDPTRQEGTLVPILGQYSKHPNAVCRTVKAEGNGVCLGYSSRGYKQVTAYLWDGKPALYYPD